MLDDDGPLQKIERFARFYRRRGYNPLPSRRCGDGKLHPPYRFSTFRDAGLSPDSFSRIAGNFRCDCIQLAIGSRWRLAVLDLDGPMAVEVWRLWAMHRDVPPTWHVRHNPSGGMHVWFRTDRPLPFKTVIWRQEGEHHSAIELLGDGNLIVAPPSISAKSGKRYSFQRGRSPRDVPTLAELPEWVRNLPDRSPECHRPPMEVAPVPKMAAAPTGDRWRMSRDEVIEAARPSAVSIARSLGLRVVDDVPNRSGWCRARSMFRPDANPSAAFNPDGLLWWEPHLGKPMSIFDAAMALSHASTFSEAMQLVGRLAGCRA